MADLTKFTPTRKIEFEQLARDRKEDFEALRDKGRWTTSVYLGPYVVEARLKFKKTKISHKPCSSLETTRGSAG